MRRLSRRGAHEAVWRVNGEGGIVMQPKGEHVMLPTPPKPTDDEKLDEELDESFPASDPPSQTDPSQHPKPQNA